MVRSICVALLLGLALTGAAWANPTTQDPAKVPPGERPGGLDLPFQLKINGDTAQVTGITGLDRTAFGVGQGEWTNTDQIPAKVTVNVDLTAKRR